MSESRAQLTREQVLLGRATSDDIARTSLICVELTPERLQACDGHMLVQADAPADMPDDMPGFYLGKAWGKAKQPGKHQPTTIARVNGHLHANPDVPDKLSVIERRDEAGPYPNTDSITPTSPVVMTVPLVAKTLKKLLSALDPDAIIRFDVPASSVADGILTGALTFTVVGSESNVHGLIMPGRITA